MAQQFFRALRGSHRTCRNSKSSSHKFRRCNLTFEALEQRQLLSVDPVISEFMASNSTSLTDYYGKNPDWLEIYNPDAAAVNLAGWKLKDGSSTWTIPAGVTIPAMGYTKVICDSRNTIAPNGELHTNFKLDEDGEYLGLLKPDNTVVSEYAPEYPPQFTDVSYGLIVNQSGTSLIGTDSTVKAFVPTTSNGGSTLGDSWTGATEPFSDSSWTSGTTGAGMRNTLEGAANLKLRLNADSSAAIATDTSGASHNGTNVGAAWLPSVTDAQSDPLIRTGVMQFNATENDQLYAPSNVSDFTGATQGTISFWMRSSGVSGTGSTGAVLMDFRSSRGMTILQTDAGKIQVQAFNSSSAVNTVSSTVSISDNLWHLVTVNFSQSSGAAISLYIDGALNSQANNTGAWSWTTGQSLQLGRSTNGYSTSYRNYTGLLDDFRFYNAQLSAAQIANVAFGAESVSSSEAGVDVKSTMQNVNASAFLRIPFTVTDVSSIQNLLLSVRYSDGFVAWINGVEVASQNAPDTLAWNSTATTTHSPNRIWSGIIDDLTLDGELGNLLHVGTNILSIQGLNNLASDASFLVMPVLASNATTVYGTEGRYFVTPTPGALNSAGTADLGPLVSNVSEPATQPLATDSIVVTAAVSQTLSSIQSDGVILHYRVMYNSEVTTTMYDDGTHGDITALDGIYSATISAGTATAGQMLRWYVSAADTLGHTSRWPMVVPIIDNDGGPEYMGTVIATPSLTSTLPIIQTFVTDVNASVTRTGSRGSVYYLGQFYDNVFFRRRGQNYTFGYKIEFNSGYDFQYAEDQPRVDEINLNDAGADPSRARPQAAFDAIRETGLPSSICFPMRVQRNNAYFGVMNFVEQVDKNFLKREGIYENAAIYKADTSDQARYMTSAATFVQKNRDADTSDAALQQLLDGLHLTDATARSKFIYDNVNIPAMIDYLAGLSLVWENDSVAKNFYLYCDTNDSTNAAYNYGNSNGTNEWTMLPWDKDLTFGLCNGFSAYYMPEPQASPLFGDSDHPKNDNADYYNRMIDAFLDVPEIKQMYLRRFRTLMDELLQPPGTAAANCYFENRFDELYAKLSGDATFLSQVGGATTFASYFTAIKNQYLAARRQYLYVTCTAGIPAAQAANVTINFGSGYDALPTSGNQDEEYITLVNPNSYAVDLSGWKLTGGIELTFKEGVIIPAGGTLYVSPNVYAFRHRATGPTGNQGLLVTGNYDGHLSKWSDSVKLINLQDMVVATFAVTGTPSAAQQFLRVTEVMYHPASPTSGTYTNEDFQFIELKNTSTSQTISLAGVQFTDGILFNFTGSNVTSLAPGAHALVISNLAAFQTRYPSISTSIIAGEFAKANASDIIGTRLAKSGEKLTLVDSVGETILSFSYQDDWFKQTDGTGNSLVIRDPLAADRDVWGQSEGWFASHNSSGSPNTDETTNYAPDAIVVNELLAHRLDGAGAMGDWVEFYNTTADSIDIGGWYLSNKNDNDDLKQYQIAAGTIIPAHGYKAFNWRDNFGNTSDPGCITPFTFGEMGGGIYLTSAVGGTLTDFQASESFGSSDTGVTLGRYIKSSGGKDFVAMSSPTYEAANSAPLVGPVVINEIYYHPATGKDSFIELKNLTSSVVNLYDPAHPQNTWHLTDGVELTFTAGATIPANGYALIVNVAPAYYRTKYSIPASVQIFGPYLFDLNKSGDTVELKYPDDPQPDGDVPYDRMDQITYGDGGLWPKAADGFGASLNRISTIAYGNDAVNWAAGTPTPGAANVITYNTSLSNSSVAENSTAATVGTLSTSTSGHTYTYLLQNDSSGKFEIVGTTLKLKAGQSLDFESQAIANLSIRTTDETGLWFDKTFTIAVTDRPETMTVTTTDWATAGAAGMTLKFAGDGKLHFYRTGTTTDIILPHVPASVTEVIVSGNQSNQLLIDSMGTGAGSLTINAVTASLLRDNAITPDLIVNINGGYLNFNGHAGDIGNLTITTAGRVDAPAISNSTTTVTSGTLSATSIICDSLVIGSSSGAAAATEKSTIASESTTTENTTQASAIAWPKFEEWPLPNVSISTNSDAANISDVTGDSSETTPSKIIVTAASIPATIAIDAAPIPQSIQDISPKDVDAVPVDLLTKSPRNEPISQHELLVESVNPLDAIIIATIALPYVDKNPLLAANPAEPAIFESEPIRSLIAKNATRQDHLAALQSAIRNYEAKFSAEFLDYADIQQRHSHQLPANIEDAVDVILASDEVLV